MLSRLTHCTSKASIIFLATVVFPEALPPHIPTESLPLIYINTNSTDFKPIGGERIEPRLWWAHVVGVTCSNTF